MKLIQDKSFGISVLGYSLVAFMCMFVIAVANAVASSKADSGTSAIDPAIYSTEGSTENLQTLPGMGGVFLRPSIQTRKIARKRDLILSHPLVDAVFLPYSWRDVEPEKGEYNFVDLLREVGVWGKAGKKVIVTVALYGQHPDDALTPPWIYLEEGVKSISFEGGGIARGQIIRIPAVWEAGFVEKYIRPLVHKLAEVVDGNPHVAFVMPGFGHIGNITCQPSPDGSRAVLAAGWSAQKWVDYCLRLADLYKEVFVNSPLLVTASGAFIRDREHRNYESDSTELLLKLADVGVSPILFGLEGEDALMKNVYQNVNKLLPLVKSGNIRLGLGDDWPLWVPEDRREHGPTRGHDDDYLEKTLINAFRDASRGTDIPTSVILCQEPEILASHPGSVEYQPAVFEYLHNARQKLQMVDYEFWSGAK